MILEDLVKTQIVLADPEDKSLASFSGMNTAATPDDIMLFYEGVNGLRSTPASRVFVVREYLLTSV